MTKLLEAQRAALDLLGQSTGNKAKIAQSLNALGQAPKAPPAQKKPMSTEDGQMALLTELKALRVDMQGLNSRLSQLEHRPAGGGSPSAAPPWVAPPGIWERQTGLEAPGRTAGAIPGARSSVLDSFESLEGGAASRIRPAKS